jgi:site-specific DNA-methyltransferase (adenine-specific)
MKTQQLALPLKTRKELSFSLFNGDALQLLKQIPSNSVHACITDPPYFIDTMGDEWTPELVKRRAKKADVVGSLPVGMKFDPQQGPRFQKFMAEVSKEVFRVLKPGGFYIAFSQARLYHRLGIAVEDAGFEVRDMMGWTYEGQAKAFSQDHFVKKMKISDKRKAEIISSLGGRKTPQLKPMIEPMVLGQKPKNGTFVDNWLEHETGLVDVTQSLDGKFPGNLMNVRKPTKTEKGEDNFHMTVKPVALIEHLIKLFTKEGQVVLDPFTGSGSHGVAALRSKRRFVGFEISQDYTKIARARLEAEVM